MPAVSVVMPVYNGERFLRRAVGSILAQSFGDFELLVVDDGSADATPAILAGYADRRLRVIRNPRNLGLVASLNTGLEAARGRFVARMDADDVAHPERLAVQLRLLHAEPRILAVGTGFEMIDEAGRFLRRDVQPLSPRLLRLVCIVRTPMLHPSVVFRASLIREHGLRYDPGFPAAEDFDFWSRVVQVGDATVIGRALMRYRVHAASTSVAQRALQAASMRRICEANLVRALPDAAAPDIAAFADLYYARRQARPDDVHRAARLIAQLLAHFAERHGPTPRERAAAARYGARWLALALLVHGDGLRRPRVLARFAAVLPRFGLPLLGEVSRAVLARVPQIA